MLIKIYIFEKSSHVSCNTLYIHIYMNIRYIAPSFVANVERYIRSAPVYILIVMTHPDNGLQDFLIDNGL